MYYDDWKPYVPAAERRLQAARAVARLARKGQQTSPVVIEGRKIASTFWGKAWCDNLERYSDYENRLPRGRTYVRNGSVVDLQIRPGSVQAMVSGSSLYRTEINVAAVPASRWTRVCRDCAGAIDSVVELLQGRLSEAVMTRICHQQTGLFPSPAEITFTCSCPDWAAMCKHVAAVLYAIGARLDQQPDLLFALRRVDQQDLITRAGRGLETTGAGPAAGKVLDVDDLSAMFGIEMAQVPVPQPPVAAVRKQLAARAKPATRVKPAASRVAKLAARRTRRKL
ncbi:MAG: SWIM zinc finger family protein [Acidobacteriota bacterium]